MTRKTEKKTHQQLCGDIKSCAKVSFPEYSCGNEWREGLLARISIGGAEVVEKLQ